MADCNCAATGVINGLVREQRDESGAGALRGARRQHRRPVKSQAAGDDRQMAEQTLVVRDGAPMRNVFKVLRLRPVQRPDAGREPGRRLPALQAGPRTATRLARACPFSVRRR